MFYFKLIQNSKYTMLKIKPFNLKTQCCTISSHFVAGYTDWLQHRFLLKCCMHLANVCWFQIFRSMEFLNWACMCLQWYAEVHVDRVGMQVRLCELSHEEKKTEQTHKPTQKNPSKWCPQISKLIWHFL